MGFEEMMTNAYVENRSALLTASQISHVVQLVCPSPAGILVAHMRLDSKILAAVLGNWVCPGLLVVALVMLSICKSRKLFLFTIKMSL